MLLNWLLPVLIFSALFNAIHVTSQRQECSLKEIFSVILHLKGIDGYDNNVSLPVFCQPSLQIQISQYCDTLLLKPSTCVEVLQYSLSLAKHLVNKIKETKCCDSFPFPTFTSKSDHLQRTSADTINDRHCDLRTGSRNKFFDENGPSLTLGWHLSPDRVPPFLWSPPIRKFDNWKKSILQRGYFVRSAIKEFPVEMIVKMNSNFSIVFLDVGANCGMISLPIAALPQNHLVYAFEPSLDMMDILCLSKVSNGDLFNRLKLVNKAVADKKIEKAPMQSQDMFFAGPASTFHLEDEKDITDLTFDTISIDEYLEDQNITLVAMMTIDTRGNEYFVFKGAANSLRYRRILCVFAENDPSLMIDQSASWKLMLSFGFQAFNPTHDIYHSGQVESTSIRMLPSAFPLNNFHISDGASLNLLWFPANSFADHLAVEQFMYTQRRLSASGKDLFLGKAYIISTKGQLPDNAIQTAEACGFFAMHLPATQPWSEHFASIEGLAAKCLFTDTITFIPPGLSAGEISLICSHRRAWEIIAYDPTIADDDWAMVLEDDVNIHPSAVDPRSMIFSAMNSSQINSAASGFIYLGLCGGFCSDFGCSIYNWSLFNPEIAFASSCAGYCTHAYLVTKRRAKSLFNYLYNGGSGCQRFGCQLDRVLFYRFMHLCEVSTFFGILPLVGPGLISLDVPTHHGVIYQTRAVNSPATRLSNIGMRSMLNNNLVAIQDDWAPKCFTVNFLGRLGNLMFQYAALVGICLSKGLSAETCASISQSPTNPEVLTMDDLKPKDELLMTQRLLLPFNEFVTVFELPAISCPLYNRFFREHAYSYSGTFFDQKMFEQPFGTTFEGYLQSYKYFHPHAQKDIQRLFSFPINATLNGDDFIRSIKRSVRLSHQQFTPYFSEDKDVSLTCVSVRRGDKVRNPSPIYDQWALSEDYYRRAIKYVHCCQTSKSNNKQLFAMAIFAGGATDSHGIQIDRDWALRHIGGMFSDQRDAQTNFTSENIFMELEHTNHFETMYTMSKCDHIVLSSSTFAWWAAYFRSAEWSNHKDYVDNLNKRPVIVAPQRLHDPNLLEFVSADYYLPEWALLSENGQEDWLPDEDCQHCAKADHNW